MVHERLITKTINLEGPLRSCVATLKAALHEIEHSILIEEKASACWWISPTFLSSICAQRRRKWYIEAEEQGIFGGKGLAGAGRRRHGRPRSPRTSAIAGAALARGEVWGDDGRPGWRVTAWSPPRPSPVFRRPCSRWAPTAPSASRPVRLRTATTARLRSPGGLNDASSVPLPGAM
jgi:hypothetical protein